MEKPREIRDVPVLPAGGWLIDPEAERTEDGEVAPIPEPKATPTLDRTPVIHGIRAVTGPETFRRTWPTSEPYVRVEVPPPMLPAVYLGEDDEEHLPPNARKMARAGQAAGWLVLVSFAIGHEIDSHGRPAHDIIWSQEVDEGGKESRRKVGSTLRPQQPSVKVRVARSQAAVDAGEVDSMFSGMWLGGTYGQPETGKWVSAGWAEGVIVFPWRRVDWSTLWRSLSEALEKEAG